MGHLLHLCFHHRCDHVICLVSQHIVMEQVVGVLLPHDRPLPADGLAQSGKNSAVDSRCHSHAKGQELEMNHALVVEKHFHHCFLCLVRAQSLLGSRIILGEPLHAVDLQLWFQHTEPALISSDDIPQEKRVLRISQVGSAEVDAQFLLINCQDMRNELWSPFGQVHVLL